MSEVRLLLGDCLDKLKEMDDNSVDSIVTDPPYGLSFMGKQWDYDVPSIEIWQECLRVLKPGGHLLAFAGSRTYHRTAVRIEDAGFEIRDMISWLYGSGFPSSMDISKQIDKREGVEREVVGYDASKARPNKENFAKRTDRQPTSTAIEGWRDNGATITAPATDLAKQWSGWGTALKPAHEPAVMARKPISEKTVVDNVLEWGTGAINIDESRIGFVSEADKKESTQKNQHADFGTKPLTGNVIYGDYSMVQPKNYNPPGRFPANLILDEEAGKLLDEQSGISKSSGGSGEKSKGALGNSVYGKYKNETLASNAGGLGDIGGASRFFYCPKVGKSERNEGLDGFEEKPRSDMNKMMGESGNFKTGSGNDRTTKFKNTHPTVKPVDLMLYLIRLVTPKGGTTLDPFMGSGSTGKAAVRGGFGFIGIEREQEYFDIAEARIEYEKNRPVSKSSDKKKNKTVEPKVEETLTKFFE